MGGLDASNDYYSVLGVDRSAAQDEVRRAFRRKAARSHPDKASGSQKKQATEAFQQLSKAAEILSDTAVSQLVWWSHSDLGVQLLPTMPETDWPLRCPESNHANRRASSPEPVTYPACRGRTMDVKFIKPTLTLCSCATQRRQAYDREQSEHRRDSRRPDAAAPAPGTAGRTFHCAPPAPAAAQWSCMLLAHICTADLLPCSTTRARRHQRDAAALRRVLQQQLPACVGIQQPLRQHPQRIPLQQLRQCLHP